MTFESPTLLWGLLLVPVAIAAYLLAQRRRARYAVRFTNLDLLANVVQRSPGWRRHVPAALYLLALSALLLSLARPQATIPVPREQATVLLVMDVSGSMNATDVRPSRLVAAKEAAKSFLDQLPRSFRVGLVSFAGSAQVLTPPTNDRAPVRAAVDSLRADGGTAMGDAIERALQVGRPAGGDPAGAPAASGSPSPTPVPPADEDPAPSVILLLSDGANSTGRTEPLQAAAAAGQAGVPVYTIALGTPTGTLNSGGRRVSVPPDEATLQRIAEVTGGRFFSAPSEQDLRAVYQDIGSRIGFVEEEQEVTALFAAAALALLVSGGGLATWWFNRFP
jgi:Ca-activated chloride channel homolog